MASNAWKNEKRRQREEAWHREREEEERKRADCAHYNCEPYEWHWSGAVRQMRCLDCGETKFIDEPEAPAEEEL